MPWAQPSSDGRINFYILFICNKIIKKKLKEQRKLSGASREFNFYDCEKKTYKKITNDECERPKKDKNVEMRVEEKKIFKDDTSV